ncbi:Cytochrome P450 89A2-like protein [Drosera capensis]
METWLAMFLTISSLALFSFFFSSFSSSQLKAKKAKNHKQPPLPPGPTSMTFITKFTLLRKKAPEVEAIIRSFFSMYGPIIKLPLGSTPTILVSNRTLIHQALVQGGQIFAARPKSNLTGNIMTSNQHNINSATYGPTWRSLRRNIVTFLHPSRFGSFSSSRKRTIEILNRCILADSESQLGPTIGVVHLFDHLKYAVFCLMSLVCFSDKLDEEPIKQLETANRRILASASRFQILDAHPILAKTLLHHRWKEFLSMRKELEEIILPLIRTRKQADKLSPEMLMKKKEDPLAHDVPTYVDSLFEVELDEDGEKRNLTEDEIITLCVEFVTAGVDTTSAVLQWIMANIIKYPDIQAKIYEEIKSVAGDNEEEIREEDLPKMTYLHAVVIEGLRRHPPLHFLLPHSVMQDTELGGCTIPKDSIMMFMLSEMGWDPEVWEEPMKFKPERFLPKEEKGSDALDITGSHGLKMMPFGAGRRICPGYAMAITHLEYFLANLVLKFEWKPVPGDDINLDEEHDPFVVMKHPIQALILPRTKQPQGS